MSRLRKWLLISLVCVIVVCACGIILNIVVSRPHPSGDVFAKIHVRLLRNFCIRYPSRSLFSFDPSGACLSKDDSVYSGGEILFREASNGMFYAAHFSVTNVASSEPVGQRHEEWNYSTADFKIYAKGSSLVEMLRVARE